MKTYGLITGIIASLLCLAAGVWILFNSGFDPNDPLAAGIGLYFIGKAFFVGPMLYLSGTRTDATSE